MSLKHTFLISVALSLVYAVTAYAASAPPNVRGIHAAMQDGKITMSWDAVSDPAGISRYNVYYSHASILGNGGNYDDFDHTVGPETRFTFPQVPLQGGVIYLSVLAVNAQGVESEAFEQEASVDISALVPASSAQNSFTMSDNLPPIPSLPTSASSTLALSLLLHSVTPQSATGVVLTFSSPLRADQGVDTTAFIILTASGGEALSILAVDIAGAHVTLTTALQKPELYVLGVLRSLTATDGAELTALPTMTFTGIASPSGQYIRNPHLPMFSKAKDPVSVSLSPTRLGDGTYRVTVRWTADETKSAERKLYKIYTSTDGKNFLPLVTVKPEDRSVEIERVEPGAFTVKVAAIDRSGNEAAGAQEAIRLSNLPRTGLGILGLLALAGAMTGARMGKRRVP